MFFRRSGSGVDAGGCQHDAIAALMFGVVKGAVGGAQECFRSVGVVRVDGHSDGNGDLAQALAAVVEADFADGLAQMISTLDGIVGSGLPLAIFAFPIGS